MSFSWREPRFAAFSFFILIFCAAGLLAQSGGTAGTIRLLVKDASGALIPNALAEITNPVSGYKQKAVSGPSGEAVFSNLPFNPYHMVVSANGFSPVVQDVDVRSVVPVAVQVTLPVASTQTSVTVTEQGADLVETEPNFHTDVDRQLFQKLPLESQSSSVSSLVTLASPGVVADSNGLFHGLGDHAENSFSVDGQPMTDQQSKVFSNQIPADSIQSLEVISGAPPAEYGDKTSLVIKVTTRSGLGVTQPTGSASTSYGSFGSATGNFDISFGGAKWGNFIAIDGLDTGRFLDPPEFQVLHAKGNLEDVFDRADFQITSDDSLHLNTGFTRSWFQTPNSYDTQIVDYTTQAGTQVLSQDQRSQIRSYNIAPTWTHLFNNAALFSLAGFARHDQYQYFPSSNVFADQPQTINQDRTLTNLGVRGDFSYVKGIHNVKAGVVFQHNLLTEDFNFGVTSPTFNSPCLDASNSPVNDTTLNDPSQCAGAGFQPNTAANPNAVSPFLPILGCNDLTRPNPSPNDGCATAQSALFLFHGHADIKEIAFYAQDAISKGPWTFNIGIRGDLYRGIVSDSQPEPRAGVAYNIKRSNTVLRASYARVMETPFNENLVLASTANGDPVIGAVIGPSIQAPIRPGARNEFHAGFEQAFGKYLVVDADYLWKYTHNGYDFSVFGLTPITFPIAWHNSKIDGASIRVSMPDFHGLSAFSVMGHVNARFFPPQVGGLGTTVGQSGFPFRIDHDQAFNQTTHVQYQPNRKLPWLGFNWRYDSGVVAGAVPFAVDTTTPVDLTGLTADQQIAAGLFCGNQVPTLTSPLTTCAPNLYGSTRIQIPAPGTENDDHNPPRIASRNLFDVALGDDNLFGGDRYKWSARFTVINLTNKVALYNFLSTFSGTHFVTPRTYTGEIGFHF